MDFKNCNIEEFWKYIASNLSQRGISTVLVGGAAVSVYTNGAYISGDLDLIVTSGVPKSLGVVMAKMGFNKEGRYFIHPECSRFFVEFPSGPVAIGDDNHIVLKELVVDNSVIKIFSPTDCIKDRLASYIYFKSRDCLDQALLVALAQPFNIKEIERWCKKEKAGDVLEEFKKNLSKAKKRTR